MPAAGAIIGPVVFIASWIVGGLVLDGYSPVTDAISRLAAAGAVTVPILNTGLAVYGLGVLIGAVGLRATIGHPAAVALATNAVLTFGVLVTPLDHSALIDRMHTLFAASAYAALALASLLAARHFRKMEKRAASVASLLVGVTTAMSLAATAIAESSGLYQRIGLTVSDVWMMVIAAQVLSTSSMGSPTATP